MSDLNVSDVLSEASTIYQQITQTEESNDNIDTALELVEDVGDSAGGIVQESFSGVNTRLLQKVMKNLTDINILENHNIKMEDGMNPTQNESSGACRCSR